MSTRAQVESWIERSLPKDFNDFKIKVIGNSEKGEGYLGDIIFVEVEGTTEENEPSRLNFVVKHAKNNDHLRKTLPVKMIFQNEIYMYDTVFPAFLKFQRERISSGIFESIPEYFYSTSSDDTEGLVLGNLKMAGYEQYDRKTPMNLAHCKAVLKQYGKFHAVSFAMRDQKRKEFAKVISNLQDPQMKFFEVNNIFTIYNKSKVAALEMLERNGYSDLREKLSNLLQKDCQSMIMDVMKKMTMEPQSVVTHGDSWCNNFMFKYDEGDKSSPSEVVILDWQLSTPRSPVFDLSYFIYAVCSETELDSFEEMLESYYSSFATHLTRLGSDPKELFSYADLKRHWRAYSIFGVIHMIGALRVFLCDKDNAPSFGEIEENAGFDGVFRDVLDGENLLYNERFKGVISHYFEYIGNHHQ